MEFTNVKEKAELRISNTGLSSLARETNENSWSPLRCKPEGYVFWGFRRFLSLHLIVRLPLQRLAVLGVVDEADCMESFCIDRCVHG